MKESKPNNELHIHFGKECTEEAINKGLEIAKLVNDKMNNINIEQIVSNACDKMNNINMEQLVSNALQSYKDLKKLNEEFIDLREANFQAPHLDIGGSGEAIIYRASKGEITIIDTDFDNDKLGSRATLFNMDASKMEFVDRSFKTVTIFYTLMYIKEKDIEKVLQETYRVLEPGGMIYIWDICTEEIYESFIEAAVRVKGRNFNKNAVYSSNAVSEVRNKEYYVNKIESVGFDNIIVHEKGNTLYLCAKK